MGRARCVGIGGQDVGKATPQPDAAHIRDSIVSHRGNSVSYLITNLWPRHGTVEANTQPGRSFLSEINLEVCDSRGIAKQFHEGVRGQTFDSVHGFVGSRLQLAHHKPSDYRHVFIERVAMH